MRRALGISFLLAIALTTAAQARPVDQGQSGLRPELPANLEQRVQLDASGKGIFSPAGTCPIPDTVEYGGTFWASDSARWEAIRDSNWTFDSGVGSSIETGSNPNKPAGYHAQMEGWYGIDQTLNPLPYFRRSSICAISGGFSLWAGVDGAEANNLCFASGQGYGNGWHMSVSKTFAYGGAGTVTLAYQYKHEIENGFDFAYVTSESNPPNAGDPVELVSYTANSAGVFQNESLTLTSGSSLPVGAGTVTISFVMDSDGSYSDEDGLNPTTCGAFVVDNISLSGAITDLTDFQAGMNGWVADVPTTGVGDFSNLVNRNTDLPPPVTFCACGVTDSVLVFYDALEQHPIDQDNIAASPIISLTRGGNTADLGKPGRLMIYDVYAEMPLANYIFVQIRARWYPSVCAATGLVFMTPWRDQNVVFYFGEAPFCVPPGLPRIRDYSGVIETSAEQIQIGFGMLNLCRTAPFGVPCTGVTNTTPWLDNIRLGIFGFATAPNLTITTFDFLQDNFASDGTLNPASTGAVDANTLKNASTPGPGSILRDTLVARGDGGNTEVRIIFKVRPGPFTLADADYGPWAARALQTAAPGMPAGWYSVRMDTAEQGGIASVPTGWMTTYHESDPGFQGTDRTPDPQNASQMGNEIFCDYAFTPGTRIDYFVVARYLPGDPRNPGTDCQWYVTPDTLGGVYQEIEILPSSMGADSSWNCTLYVDHHHDRSLFDQTLEEAGLTGSLGTGSNNAEGTRYDRFDNRTPSSGQLSFGRPIQTRYGASIIQTFAYKNIAWHAADLSSIQLTDEDATIVGPWLALRGIGNNRFWGSGDGLATSMNASGEPSTVNFMLTTLGVIRRCNTIRDVNCPNPSALDSTFCLPTSAVAGSRFASPTLPSARGNGCPDLRSFDLLSANGAVPSATGQLNYVKNTVNTNYASVTNWNTVDVDYKTVLDGFAVGRARNAPGDPHIAVACTTTTASTLRTDNVLDWFASAVNCKIPAGLNDVPVEGTPKPPAFRAALGNAYPNPMNPTTRIQFTNGTENGRVTLKIFDVTGRLVKNLVDGKMTAGVHEVTWDGGYEDGSTAPSGMYFYKMTAGGGFTASKKLVMMK